ncbi:MAG: hypothetical protein U9N09_04290 [Euryarchaeota archaeon]|nr:hypothetical protein [Euryarchaeota archaeon]
MKIHGWTGKIATIDLDCGTVGQEKLSLEVARDFLGGRGIGASIPCETNDFSDSIILPKVAKTDAVYYSRCSVRDDSCFARLCHIRLQCTHTTTLI